MQGYNCKVNIRALKGEGKVVQKGDSAKIIKGNRFFCSS